VPWWCVWIRDKLEPLIANRVLAVEGIADRIIVQQVADLTNRNLDRIGVSVVETDGAGSMDAIVKLFGSDGFNVPDAVFTCAGIPILRSPIQAPRANAIMKRWIGGCRRELIERTLICNQRHLLKVLRDYQAHHNEHRPHRSLKQPAPLRPLPAPVTDLDTFRIHRRDRIGGILHKYKIAS
jgi:hypothetical protein